MMTSYLHLIHSPDIALSLMQHAKKWSKYLKDVINFLEKRAALGVG